jgi:tetratricopeptide (TPR) repeat protein
MTILSICRIAELYSNTLKLKDAVNKFREAIRLITKIIVNKDLLLNNEKNINLFFDKFRDYIIENNTNDSNLLEIKNFYSASIRISKYFLIKKDFALGLQYFNRVKQLSEEFEELNYSLDSLILGIAVTAFESQSEKSLEFIDKAIELLGSTSTGAYLLVFKSKYLDRIQTEEYLKSALKIFESSKNRKTSNVPMIYFMLGTHKLENNEKDEAIVYINKAKKSLKLPQQEVTIDESFSSANSAFNGKCLIINNNLSFDVKGFLSMFENLKFTTDIKNELSYSVFRNEIIKIQENKEFSKINSFIMIIISNGNINKLMFFDEDEQKYIEVMIEEIVDMFDNIMCKHLFKKPKIFIFITYPDIDENSEEKREIGSDQSVKEKINYCPISDICVWNIHFNNQKDVDINLLTQTFEKYIQEQEITDFFKSSVSFRINFIN